MNTTLFLLAAYVVGLGILLIYGVSLWARLNTTEYSADGDGGRP